MINITISFKGRIQFDLDTTDLPEFLKNTDLTLEEFLEDRDMVLDYIQSNWENLDVDIPSDELDVDTYEVGKE